jgi:hypothetical protein
MNTNITEFLDKEEEFITFINIKTQLNKIILFDRPNLNYYELILSIINTFEDGLINEYKTHFDEYIQIFKILQTMRVPINEISNLKKIIICE